MSSTQPTPVNGVLHANPSSLTRPLRWPPSPDTRVRAACLRGPSPPWPNAPSRRNVFFPAHAGVSLPLHPDTAPAPRPRVQSALCECKKKNITITGGLGTMARAQQTLACSRTQWNIRQGITVQQGGCQCVSVQQWSQEQKRSRSAHGASGRELLERAGLPAAAAGKRARWQGFVRKS